MLLKSFFSWPCTDDEPNRLFNGDIFKDCISDTECNEKPNYHVFNHFDVDDDFKLIPECRSQNADPSPGFTCGSNPTLETGTKLVVKKVPDSGTLKGMDKRKVTLLKHADYEAVQEKLKTCPKEEDKCENIVEFKNGCSETREENDLVIFENPFKMNDNDCKPSVVDHKNETGWVEEKTIFVG